MPFRDVRLYVPRWITTEWRSPCSRKETPVCERESHTAGECPCRSIAASNPMSSRTHLHHWLRLRRVHTRKARSPEPDTFMYEIVISINLGPRELIGTR